MSFNSNFNEKYNIMTFKASYGNHSIMKKLIKKYIKDLKDKDNQNIIVMEECDDKNTKTWVVGNKENIKKMIDDDLIENN